MEQGAVIFPGQGAQAVGMGRDIAESSPRARELFKRADDVLGFGLSALCFDGPPDELGRTDIQQPAIFVVSVAIWEAFLEAGGSADQFRTAAGLSLGEYTALHISGAMSFEDALRLVHRRGQLMQEAAESAPGGMVSLLDADEAKAEILCEKAGQGDVLVPANFNCPGQVVISGSCEACGRAVELAEEVGCRAVPLVVAGAFHSPLMEPAAEGLSALLKQTPFTSPRINVVSNVNAQVHTDPDSIRDWLSRQLTHPVLWQSGIEAMIRDGIDHFVEMGPGRVLTGLMRKIDRRKKAVSVNSAPAIQKALLVPTAE